MFDLAKEVPRPGQRAELLASWYLRFNGYFPLPGFILHDAGAVKQPGGQLTEADVLAVRLPHAEERIERPDGFIQVRVDSCLDVQPGVWDFALVEATCQPPRGECKFNWMDEASGRIEVSYLTYCLRRFGFWDPAAVPTLAGELSEKRIHMSGEPAPVRIRLLSFGVTPSEGLWGIRQVTFESVLQYFQRPLFGCYGPDIVSDHKQWHPMICEIYNRLEGHKTKRSSPGEILTWLFPGVSITCQ